MRSFLTINRPWQGTGNSSHWTFSGRDERDLADCLDRLAEFATENVDDRWTAAIVFGPEEALRARFRGYRKWLNSNIPERAWTIDGALALADLLPDTMADLRTDLIDSFTRRKQGWQGDATTPPPGHD